MSPTRPDEHDECEDRLIESLVASVVSEPDPETDCPDAGRLASLAEGRIDGHPREQLISHVSSCATCRVAVVAVSEELPDEAETTVGGPASAPFAHGDRSTPVEELIPGLRRATHEPTPARDDGETLVDPTSDAGAVEDASDAADASSEEESESEDEDAQRIGGYRVVRELGAGGMGVVHEVVNESLGRPEALKVLRAGLGDDEAFAARFHRETRAMANLAHDHVVTVYDFGRIDGSLYYTMPLMPGASLLDVVEAVIETGEEVPGEAACAVLDRFGLAPAPDPDEPAQRRYARRIAAALTGVADALVAVHELGMVHRDIKPANLMIDGKGRVLLADFGLVHSGQDRLTAAGQMLGTPAYMSPEQVRSKDHVLDGRADVYSLGASLYELLTLSPPLCGSSTVETISKVLDERPAPVTDRNPEAPEELSVLVGRCLEKSPDLRYADAAALRDDLRRFADGGTIDARPIGTVARATHWVRHNWLATAAAAVVVAGTSIGVIATTGGPAYLSVAALPGAQVLLDGRPLGPTPVVRAEVEPGEYEIELVRDGFHPSRRRVELQSGGLADIERSLVPLDPADPAVLQAMAEALGVAVAKAEQSTSRSAEGDVLQAIAPRGLVRTAPSAVTVASAYEIEDAVARVVRLSDGSEVGTWVLPTWVGTASAEVPESVRTALVAGETYRWEVRLDDMEELGATEFTVADADRAAAIDARLDALTTTLPPGLPEDSEVRDLLRGQVLVAEGLFSEALGVADQLYDRLGNRQVVTTLARAALEGAELQETEPWTDWLTRADEAK